MPFGKALFIRADTEFNREFAFQNSAPRFRKRFWYPGKGKAVLRICGLGIAYCYINGTPVSEDLFTAPVSDYTKTLWYTLYDVTALLRPGENTIAVICGNGWYNETIPTTWRFHEAPWRDAPKFILRLELPSGEAVVSDGTWRCCPDSEIRFNQLRMGEYYDANLADGWTEDGYDDSGWGYAAADPTPPAGVFRQCLCEPVREHEVLEPVQVVRTGENRWVYDFGQNISGYIRLAVTGKKGQLLTVRYAECVDGSFAPAYYGMDTYYCKEGFQTDKFICSGKKTLWSPRFAYHGFRYAEITGCSEVLDAKAVFVHQQVARRTEFTCSDPYINRLFHCGIISSQSNMFYALTDCPTREKLGWTNDAQSSCEQMLTNFEAEKLLTKWHQDIRDAMNPEGALPGIVPTSGWGFHWGNGPVSDGILFEIPYRIWLHTGNRELLTRSLPYFRRYLAYLESRKEENGLVTFGLDDWAAPGGRGKVEAGFINAVLISSFYRIAALAASLCADPEEASFREEAEKLRNMIRERHVDEKGFCTVHAQCAVAMLIYYGIYRELEPLKAQLEQLLEESDYHLDCGMVGMRRLLHALSKCGLSNQAMRLLKGEGYPGYRVWMDNGATSLWEKWDIHVNSDSKNHHMYSDVLSWLVKTLGGIRLDESRCGELVFLLEPEYLEGIDHVRLQYRTVAGNILVAWRREGAQIQLTAEKDPGVKLLYRGSQIRGKSLSVTVKTGSR